MTTLCRILVASDFEPESDAALRWAGCLARGLGATIHLRHAVRDQAIAVGPPEVCGHDPVRRREDAVADAALHLATQAAACGAPAATCEAVVGGAAETIARRACELPADVVVLGTHDRSGITRMLIGSVAERVIRLASCPVVTVRGNGAVRVASGGGIAAERAAASQQR